MSSNKNITTEEVKHLADLVKIQISDEEAEKYKKQFISILDYIDQLNEVDTENVKTFEWTYPQKNPLRKDIPKDSLKREAVLKNSKNKNEKFFIVPTVVTK